MTSSHLAVLALAVSAAAFVQGMTGIGFALIVGPVLGLTAPELLPVTVLLLMLPLNVYVFLRERRATDAVGVAWISVGRLVGTAGGFLILVVLSLSQLNLFVGIATVLAVIATWAAPSFEPGRRAFVVAGLITGITETATGVGGPPLALVYQHQRVNVMRSTVALCFLIGQLFSVAALAVAGRVSAAQMSAFAWLLLPLLLGAYLSHRLHSRVQTRFLRVFVLAFAFVSGAILIASAVRAT